MVRRLIAFVISIVAAVTIAVGATPFSIVEQGAIDAVPGICRPDGTEPQTRLYDGESFENDPSAQAKRAMASAFEPMLAGMIASLAAQDGDAAYLCAMISHAQGAIALAWVQIQLGRDQAAVDLARQLIVLKLEEIGVLTRQLNYARV